MIVLLTVRGYLKKPTIIVVDTAEMIVIDKIEFDLGKSSYIPDSKFGFSGIAFEKGYYYVSYWDSFLILDSKLNLVEKITHQYFSDLHGISAYNNQLLIASTNLDSIVKVNLSNPQNAKIIFSSNKYLHNNEIPNDIDFRSLTKEKSEYHHLHINCAFDTGKHTLIGYLGKPPKASFSSRIKKYLGIDLKREGGVLIIDNENGKIVNKFHCEGVHDPFVNEERLYFTQYFSNSLLPFNITDSKFEKQIPLDVNGISDNKVLCRAGIKQKELFIIGQTVYEGWKQNEPACSISKFSIDGEYLEETLVLKNFVGIYEMVEFRGLANDIGS